MVNFTACRRTIFTVQRDVKDAHTKLLHVLRLHSQAFDHTSLHTAVMIADRQPMPPGLRTQQNFAWMHHKREAEQFNGLQQVCNASLLVLQFFERFIDALLAERINTQAFHQLVFATFASHGKSEQGVLGDTILAV